MGHSGSKVSGHRNTETPRGHGEEHKELEGVYTGVIPAHGDKCRVFQPGASHQRILELKK